MGKEMFATNADQLWAPELLCLLRRVPRRLTSARNNFRNKPITHERDHNGFSGLGALLRGRQRQLPSILTTVRNYCSSWAFVQGGSPYDKCTKRVLVVSIGSD